MPTERIPLAQPLGNRAADFSKDSRTTNCVFESRGQAKEFVKREGLTKVATVVPVPTPPAIQAQGLFEYANLIIAVVSNNLYSIDPSNSYLVTYQGAITTTTDKVYFARTFNESYLFLQNLTDGYVYSKLSGYITHLDPAHAALTFPPGPYVPGAVFLDNYVFIGTAWDSDKPNRIYNSALGDASTWAVGGDYISFEQTGDSLVAIAKHLNYLLAFGKRSIQFFYDQGTAVAGVGSPLGVAPSYTSEVGCAAPNSIVSTDNSVFWVGTSKINGFCVYCMDGSAAVRISTEYVDRFLENDPMVKVSAYCHRIHGHVLYILTLHVTQVTLVYDITTKVWNHWTMYALASTDETNPGTWYESYFRPTVYASVLTAGYCMNDDTGEVYYLDRYNYTDDGQSIYCRSVTPLLDSGSTNRKFFGRLEIVGDKQPGAVLQVRHTGNDYASWSAWRTLDLNQGRAQMYLGGSDRRRAYEFLCTSATPLRIEAAEMVVTIGGLDQEQGQGGGG